MLSKILLTLIVIVTGFFLIRHRILANAEDEKTRASNNNDKQSLKEQAEFSSDLRFAAYMTVMLMVGLASVLYYFRWQEDHQVLTITLHRENQVDPVSYQVYRFQLQERSFVTIDGTIVTLADNERMEVLGLDQ